MNKQKIQKVLVYTFIVIAFAGIIGVTTKEAATVPIEDLSRPQVSENANQQDSDEETIRVYQ